VKPNFDALPLAGETGRRYVVLCCDARESSLYGNYRGAEQLTTHGGDRAARARRPECDVIPDKDFANASHAQSI
jgi:hypothetical protein